MPGTLLALIPLRILLANRLKNERDKLVDRGKKSHLSIQNKLLIYKAVIKPIWSYGIELWGWAIKSNIVIKQ